jgi:YD repeat-containing protein
MVPEVCLPNISTGVWEYQPNKTESFTLDMAYDTIHNIASKDQRHIRTQPSGTEIEQQRTTYDWTYSYASAQPHAPSLIGDRAYSYDLNGNQTGWDSLTNGTRRTIVWDEENRIQSVADNGRTRTYKYDDAGERVIKRGSQGETAYVNQFFTVRNREVSTMHVFAGGTRMVSKLVRQPRDVDGDGVVDPIDGCANPPWGWTVSGVLTRPSVLLLNVIEN